MASVINSRRRIADLKEIETIVAAFVAGKKPTDAHGNFLPMEQVIMTNPLLQTIHQLIREEQGYDPNEIHKRTEPRLVPDPN